MKKFWKDIVVGIKGFLMGAANVVPGVSGGTMALITGIYEEIIGALNSVMEPATWKALIHGKFKEFWKAIHGRFLIALVIGVAASIFSLAKLIETQLAYHSIQVWAFFFGLIVASAVVMFIGIKDWKLRDILMVIIGLALGVAVCTLSPTETPDDLWFIFICGAISICTMILPGISGSFILVIMSKYDYIMSAISELNIPVLVVFALGCAVGILAFAKFLHWLLARWQKQTMLVLLGFVLGSLVKVWPWANTEAIFEAQLLRGDHADLIDMQIPSAIIWCILGIGIIAVIERISKKKHV